ncbi:hypothetical protein [Nocardia sp. NPDC057030]|uniref:hypothetical protein n=1 Tax=unclassified Nocardia TaxID=2637762 RepID=UPI00363D960B
MVHSRNAARPTYIIGFSITTGSRSTRAGICAAIDIRASVWVAIHSACQASDTSFRTTAPSRETGLRAFGIIAGCLTRLRRSAAQRGRTRFSVSLEPVFRLRAAQPGIIGGRVRAQPGAPPSRTARVRVAPDRMIGADRGGVPTGTQLLVIVRLEVGSGIPRRLRCVPAGTRFGPTLHTWMHPILRMRDGRCTAGPPLSTVRGRFDGCRRLCAQTVIIGADLPDEHSHHDHSGHDPDDPWHREPGCGRWPLQRSLHHHPAQQDQQHTAHRAPTLHNPQDRGEYHHHRAHRDEQRQLVIAAESANRRILERMWRMVDYRGTHRIERRGRRIDERRNQMADTQHRGRGQHPGQRRGGQLEHRFRACLCHNLFHRRFPIVGMDAATRAKQLRSGEVYAGDHITRGGW